MSEPSRKRRAREGSVATSVDTLAEENDDLKKHNQRLALELKRQFAATTSESFQEESMSELQKAKEEIEEIKRHKEAAEDTVKERERTIELFQSERRGIQKLLNDKKSTLQAPTAVPLNTSGQARLKVRYLRTPPYVDGDIHY